MNKQKRTFVILAIVLAACLAGYLGLLNYNKYKSDDDSESESDSVEALSLDSVCAPWARSNGCKSRTRPDSGKCIAEQQGCPSRGGI